MYFIDIYMYVKVWYVVKILGRVFLNNLFLYILIMFLVLYIICIYYIGKFNLDLDFLIFFILYNLEYLIILRLNLRINVKNVFKLRIV